jgi:hypothetical protein
MWSPPVVVASSITSNSCVVHPSPPTIAMSIQPHFFHFCNHCNHCVCMKERGKARERKGYMFNLIPWLFFVWMEHWKRMKQGEDAPRIEVSVELTNEPALLWWKSQCKPQQMK